MAETAKYSIENDVGCGFIGSFFQLRSFKTRNVVMLQTPPHPMKQKQQQLSSQKSAKTQPVKDKKAPKKAVSVKPRSSDAARSSSSSSNSSNKPSQVVNSTYTRKITKEPTVTSSELSLTLTDQRKKLEPNGALYRASTGNVMLLGHLGNLKGKGGKSGAKGAVMGTVLKNHQLGNILNSSMNRVSPDVIKSLGNDKHKQGKYEEALALYDQAIAIDPRNASYYSNKSAALMGLGRLVEAVFQCREAVRIDFSYRNAHFRIAKLYLRLGVAEEAIYHYKCSGRKASPKDIAQAQSLKSCLERCTEAQNLGDWDKLLNESQIAVSTGADSAPQIYAMKAEALIKLHRHQEAYTAVQNVARFSVEVYAQFLGSYATATLLEVHSLVYMANGRFEDAVTSIQQALKLDCSDGLKSTADRVKLVASARSNGNRLFKESRFPEALNAYNNGLEKDPYNSVLLCNRAACRYKLGQYEKAVEDCTLSLRLRPSYIKARLRRANCYVQLEKWEAAIQDYEEQMRETPGDEEVKAALLEAKLELNKMLNNGSAYKETHTILQQHKLMQKTAPS